MSSSECPPTGPDKDEGGHCTHTHTHRLTSTAGFIGRPLVFGTDLWLVLLCAVTLGAHLGHSANRARKKGRIFDVKCQKDETSRDATSCQSHHGSAVSSSMAT